MAWALQFDGVNDYCTMPTWSSNGDFTLSGFFDYTDATKIFVGSSLATTPYLATIAGGDFRIRFANATINVPGMTVGTNKPYLIQRVGTLVTYDIDGVTGSVTNSTVLTFDRIANWSGSLIPYIGNTYDDMVFNTSGDSRSYSMTLSSHAAGTVTVLDTIGGNNATGVNMPTDGSAWVDLGGGGISIAVTLGTIEYNSNDTTIVLAGTVDVTATLGAINYSSNDAVIQVLGDVNVIATLGAINYASNDTVISLFGNVDVTATLGAIDYNSNDTSVSLLGGINVNATLGAINYTSNDTTITLQGQVALITTLGTISYDSNNVIVQIGTGQIIGNITAGFADNLYSAGFKPSEITVNFKT